MIDVLSDFFNSHTLLIEWLVGSSVFLFLLGLILVPWLITRIPVNYFAYKKCPKKYKKEGRLVWFYIVFLLLRNLLGLVFILLGIVLLVLPGQGILTILLGLMISKFPGKYKLELWLIQHGSIQKSVNWLRKKAHQEPLNIV